MASLANLPDPDGGSATLLELAELLGDEYVYKLLRAIRNDKPNADGVTEYGKAMHQLALRMHENLKITRPDLIDDRDSPLISKTKVTVRRTLADKLGYTPKTRTNFYNILDSPGRTGTAQRGARAAQRDSGGGLYAPGQSPTELRRADQQLGNDQLRRGGLHHINAPAATFLAPDQD